MPDFIIGMTAFLFIMFFIFALRTENPDTLIVYTLLAASAFTFLFMFVVVP